MGSKSPVRFWRSGRGVRNSSRTPPRSGSIVVVSMGVFAECLHDRASFCSRCLPYNRGSTMPNEKIWTLTQGEGPLLAAAIHDGHAIRRDLIPLLALDEAQRLRDAAPAEIRVPVDSVRLAVVKAVAQLVGEVLRAGLRHSPIPAGDPTGVGLDAGSSPLAPSPRLARACEGSV